jgi:hypothetical protein
MSRAIVNRIEVPNTAGCFLLGRRVQNLPFMGGEPNFRVPWIVRQNSDLAYAGLLYAVGGRSLTWGGWSPELLHAGLNVNDEMTAWPPAVIADLQAQYFFEAGEQIGTNATNDFIYGPLHERLRQILFAGLGAAPPGGPLAALPLAQLPNSPVARLSAAQRTSAY